MRHPLLLALAPAAFLPAIVALLPRESLWLAAPVYHLYCFFIPRYLGVTRAEAGLRAGTPRQWLPLTLALSALLIGGAWFAGPWLLAQLPPSIPALAAGLQPRALFALYSLLVNPLLEEYFWRGAMLPRLGATRSAILFALIHFTVFAMLMPIGDALLFSLPILAAGWVWGWMRVRFGSLWPGVVTHAAADAAIMIVIGI